MSMLFYDICTIDIWQKPRREYINHHGATYQTIWLNRSLVYIVQYNVYIICVCILFLCSLSWFIEVPNAICHNHWAIITYSFFNCSSKRLPSHIIYICSLFAVNSHDKLNKSEIRPSWICFDYSSTHLASIFQVDVGSKINQNHLPSL